MRAAAWVADRFLMPRREPSLTVLCYHRVADELPPDVLTHIASTSQQFEQHLDFLEERFTVVGMDDLAGWLDGAHGLPPRAAMITFDDGYRDNYTVAYPILRRRGLPATIFLATDHIESAEPFWWDRVAHAFHHATVSHPVLPFLGTRDISDPEQQEVQMEDWLYAAKEAPDEALREALVSLEEAVGVKPPTFIDMQLTWSQVSEMHGNGIEIGAHSRTHPILTRLPHARAAAEIRDSVDRIHAELGTRPQSFAYPNGGADHFNSALQQSVSDAGVPLAFTLLNGPAARLREVRARPHVINRTYVGWSDTPERLSLKISGLGRIATALRNPFGESRAASREHDHP
jgi:peptidoglycan/xylan/chitin deacetylase (PgdA/CDA1 family)